MKRKKKRDGIFIKTMEWLGYLLITYCSYLIVFRLDLFLGYTNRNYVAFNETIVWVLVLSGILFLSSGILNTVNKSKSENFATIIMCAMGILMIYLAIAFLKRGFAMPRSVIILGFFIQVFFFTLLKSLFLLYIRSNQSVRKVLILAPMDQKQELVEKVLLSQQEKDYLKYYLDPNLTPKVMKYVKASDKIYLSDFVSDEIKDKVVCYCINVDKRLCLIPKTYEISILKSRMVQIEDVPIFKINSLHLSDEKRFLKRVFDLCISIPAFVIFLPLMMVIALVIMLTDGFPIFYRQTRVTYNNRNFTLYKFRSMYNDAEKKTGAVIATEDDPRITKCGKFLRRFWLDELPQLYNVIIGDMSLVGPRPERPVFFKKFSKQIPDFQYRVSVKAGVTGLAQVLGKYATSAENKIKFDLLYIKNSNILFDMKIIIETVKKVILGTIKNDQTISIPYNDLLESNGLKEEVHTGIINYRKI